MTDFIFSSEGDAYCGLMELAEQCKDNELKQKYDSILLSLSTAFGTLRIGREYSCTQKDKFSNGGYMPCGEYVVEKTL